MRLVDEMQSHRALLLNHRYADILSTQHSWLHSLLHSRRRKEREREIPRRALAFCGAPQLHGWLSAWDESVAGKRRPCRLKSISVRKGLLAFFATNFLRSHVKWSTGASIPQQEPRFHIQTGTSFPQSLAVSL